MGEIQTLIANAIDMVKVTPEAGPYEFTLRVKTTRNSNRQRTVGLSVPKEAIQVPWTCYSIPLGEPAPVSPLPLQFKNKFTGDYPSLAIRTVIRLLVLSDEGTQLKTFNPPLLLSYKLDATDIVIGELLDLILPDTDEIDPERVAKTAANLRDGNFDELAMAALERWEGVLRRDLTESDPLRLDWLKERYALFTVLEGGSAQGENWEYAPTLPKSFRQTGFHNLADPEPERAGVLMVSELAILPDPDPVIACKANHRR